jgi:transcriptional regulator with GAF, ATPase, and Fis domain
VEVARFTDASVLVTGESGTGKERVAQLIHELDPRPKKNRLVVLDCSTVVPSLSGSEFFGHDKGAFTGAAAPREGAFELADGGTLFLDEVGELSVALQAELLRVIQEGTFKRVGSNMWRKSSFRLVCATNRDLATEQAKGTFRNDFYYRIAGCRLHLPSLRDRTDDIIPLFRHFFREVYPERESPTIEDGVRELLVNRAYPGNVRDLRNLVLRIAHRHLGDGCITVGDIPDHERPPGLKPVPAAQADGFEHGIRRMLAQGATLEDITSAAADTAMRLVVKEEGGSLRRATARLGVPEATLAERLHPQQESAAAGSSP